jgi:mRNA-degrading endonuclease toxin of MazEF toxin-antitoxin module
MAVGVPQRWHVYVVDLEHRAGTKPGKQRPWLVIQPTEFGDAGLRSTVVLPITTKLVRGEAFPLRVRLPAGICRLVKDSDVLVDQILAWDNELFSGRPRRAARRTTSTRFEARSRSSWTSPERGAIPSAPLS